MGYTLRTKRYRLVAWLDYRNVHEEPLFLELYDHTKDSKESETPQRNSQRSLGPY